MVLVQLTTGWVPLPELSEWWHPVSEYTDTSDTPTTDMITATTLESRQHGCNAIAYVRAEREGGREGGREYL